MKPGLDAGSRHLEVEQLVEITSASPSLPADGVWVLVMAVEHAARRWMTEFMEPGEQSVGVRVEALRLLPVSSSATLHSTAELTEVRGRRYLFDVEIWDDLGALVATGKNERAVVSVAG